jgi:hypothetical protein
MRYDKPIFERGISPPVDKLTINPIIWGSLESFVALSFDCVGIYYSIPITTLWSYLVLTHLPEKWVCRT